MTRPIMHMASIEAYTTLTLPRLGFLLTGGGGGGGVGCPHRKFFNFQPYLTLNFPQYFFDLSLIRIRKKKIQNGWKCLMTSWEKYAVTSWQVAIWKKKNCPNWSYIIFRKSQKISGQTSKGFRNMQQSIQPRARCPPPPPPPPVWVGLNKYKPMEIIKV